MYKLLTITSQLVLLMGDRKTETNSFPARFLLICIFTHTLIVFCFQQLVQTQHPTPTPITSPVPTNDKDFTLDYIAVSFNMEIGS